MRLYVIGSLRNPRIPHVSNHLRASHFRVFDDWYAAGPEADDRWQDYETRRDRTYAEALKGHAARHVFEFDRHHLDASDGAVLVQPAGKSGHLEFGYMIGSGKPGWIFYESGPPERWDVMVLFATGIAFSLNQLIDQLREYQRGDT